MSPFDQDRELSDALDTCLERMAEGASIDDCLREREDLSDQLRPLLEAAEVTSLAASSIAPSAAAKMRGRAILQRNLQGGGASTGRRRLWRMPRPVSVTVAATVALAVIIFGGGSIAAAAAADSVPGDSLYWVKRTKESVMLGLSRSDEGKAKMHAELAGERGEEMGRLIEQGRISAAERHLDAVQGHLKATADYVGVVVTFNRIETPTRPDSLDGNDALLALLVTLESDGDLLRIRPVALGTASAGGYDERVDQLRRDFELSYWFVVAALAPDAAGGPFWTVRTISIQSPVR